MNHERIMIGSNFKTRAVICFIIEKVELRMAASIAKDYHEFVELVTTGAAENYIYRKGIFYDTSWPLPEIIKWTDPEINVDEVNQYLDVIRFKRGS